MMRSRWNEEVEIAMEGELLTCCLLYLHGILHTMGAQSLIQRGLFASYMLIISRFPLSRGEGNNV